jgi:hypothetical protein
MLLSFYGAKRHHQQKPGEPPNDPAARPLLLFCKGRDACFPTSKLHPHRITTILQPCEACKHQYHVLGSSRGAAPRFLIILPAFHRFSSFNYHHNYQLQQHSLHSVYFSHFSQVLTSFYHYFSSKMGPFHTFKSIRVPYLHHSPRFPSKTIINMTFVSLQAPRCRPTH